MGHWGISELVYGRSNVFKQKIYKSLLYLRSNKPSSRLAYIHRLRLYYIILLIIFFISKAPLFYQKAEEYHQPYMERRKLDFIAYV